MNIDKTALTEKTLSLLEYPKIMESVASFSVSTEAADIIKNSKPLQGEIAVETKTKVRVIYELKKSGEEEPREWLPSIGFLIPKIETEGTVLDLDEALAVGLFVERGMEVVNWVKKSNEKNFFSLLSDSFVINIPVEIFKIIDRDGNLRDLP